MLRPAKLFHSFHQVRHYVQTKVTELVVQHPPPPFLLPPSTTPSNALTHNPSTTAKTLTHGLERQVPTMNKPMTLFSRGAIHSGRPTVAPFGGSCLHRGISLSNTTQNGYHGLGAFRSYSSATTPFMRTFTSVPTPSQSVFSYISSGIFAPMTSHCGGVSTTTKYQTTPRPHQQQQQEQQSVDMIDRNSTHPLLSNEHFLSNTKVTATAAAVSTELLCKHDDLTMNMTEKTLSTSNTYFYITLDLVPTFDIFYSNNTGNDTSWKPWTKELVPRLMDWKDRQQQYYDRLLEWLQLCVDKGYYIQQVGSSLRLYFPKHVVHRNQALVWLEELKKSRVRMEDDGLSDWQLEHETISVDESLVPLGPDYFQGIHLFLSHIDDLVDHGPAFAHSSWSM